MLLPSLTPILQFASQVKEPDLAYAHAVADAISWSHPGYSIVTHFPFIASQVLLTNTASGAC